MRTWLLSAVGVILIVLSGVALSFDGIPYTEERTVLEIGGFEATAETRERIRVPAWAAWAGLAAGVIVLVVGVSERNRG